MLGRPGITNDMQPPSDDQLLWPFLGLKMVESSSGIAIPWGWSFPLGSSFFNRIYGYYIISHYTSKPCSSSCFILFVLLVWVAIICSFSWLLFCHSKPCLFVWFCSLLFCCFEWLSFALLVSVCFVIVNPVYLSGFVPFILLIWMVIICAVGATS